MTTRYQNENKLTEKLSTNSFKHSNLIKERFLLGLGKGAEEGMERGIGNLIYILIVLGLVWVITGELLTKENLLLLIIGEIMFKPK